MRRLLYIYIIIIIGFTLVNHQTVWGQTDSEINEKTKYIARFITFMKWPKQSLNHSRGVFVVGVVCDDAAIFAEIAGNLERLSYEGRKVEVRQITQPNQIDYIPIIYITNNSSMLSGDIIPRVGERAILLINERENLAGKTETDINFIKPTQKDNWLYEIVVEKIRLKGITVPPIIENEGKVISLSNKTTKIIRIPGPTETKIEKVYVENKEAEAAIRELELKNKRMREEQEKALKELSSNPEFGAEYQAYIDSLRKIRNEDSLILMNLQAKVEADKATLQAKEAEKTAALEQQKTKDAERKTQLAILGGLVLLLLSLSLIFFTNSRRRKRIINELEQTKIELSDKANALNEQNDKLEQTNILMDQKNEELEEQNKKITDSIRYAETIQKAMLPSEAIFQQLFDDHFVIYEPKDIVSGDFYWLTQLEEKTLIAVVDCTGHGVPGAFMSTIGVDLLNEIVNKQREYSPANILELLHNGIFERLRQNDTNNRDGMDVCLCLICPANNNQFLITFSGAKRPLYYIQDNELKRINGDSKYIGGIKKDKQDFQNYDIILKKGDTLYLSTDGYADSPNANRRKFGSMRFQEMLNAHHSKSLTIQKEIFLSELNEHRQDTPSRDDITFVAVRL